MHDISRLIEREYGLKIYDIRPFRAGYILNTSLGCKFIKRCSYSTKRIEFIHAAKTHLLKNGYIYIDNYSLTQKDKKPFIETEEYIYTMADFIEGHECEFSSDDDVVKAAFALGKLHSAGRGFKPAEKMIIHNELGKLPFYLSKKLNEIKKLKKKAEKERKEFDYLFLQSFEHFYKMGEQSIEKLYLSKYNMLINKAKLEGEICHGDYSYQNIIVKENAVFTINFDYCNIKLKLHDLVDLIRKKMRKSSWDILKAKMILETYSEVEKIDKDELYVIESMLQFPQKFWKIVNRYYNSRRSWAQKNFVMRLKDLIKNKENHKRFIREFHEVFCKKNENIQKNSSYNITFM